MRFDNWTDLASRHAPLRLHELAVREFRKRGQEIFRCGQLSSFRATLPQMKSTTNCVNAGETVNHLAGKVAHDVIERA